MNDQVEPRVLRMLRRFPVAPERVFDAWTDPALAKLWLFGSPTSEAHETVFDPRVGGRWRISDTRGGTEYVAEGEYLVFDRPHRLSFTFSMLQFSPNSDTITVELEAVGDGTLMTFTQAGTDIAAELAQVPKGEQGGSETGWHYMFLGLAEVVQGRVPQMPPSHI